MHGPPVISRGCIWLDGRPLLIYVHSLHALSDRMFNRNAMVSVVLTRILDSGFRCNAEWFLFEKHSNSTGDSGTDFDFDR